MFSSTFSIDTNGLFLEIMGVSNGAAWFNLHNASNQVYAITSKSNFLSAGWNIEQEVWPTNPAIMPFTVPTLARQNLFMRAEDWTDVDSNGDGIPDWWTWQYFGTESVAVNNLDYSDNGYTFADDYNYDNPPTVFKFTGIEVTNNYVSSSSVAVQLDVAGYPYYVATLVDDGNFSNAVWNAYSGSSMTANLGLTGGWHEVWIGLRGHADDPSVAVWQRKRLKLYSTPPALIITSPTNGTVDVPMIQLTGYSPEPLSSISYDLSNTAGTVTNQPILVLNQYYDTTTWEFTTNTFQGFDIILTNGVNTFTLYATDLAGNVTTLVTNFTLDYSAKTNPPVVQITWPQAGVQLSGSNFTVTGWVADPTVTITTQLVLTNGSGTNAYAYTNMYAGEIDRNGNFWLENLSLHSGTNPFTITVRDAAGNTSVTNISVIQSTLVLTVNPVTPDSQLWQPTVNLTGTISDPTYAVWVNGVKGTNYRNGSWAAFNVPPGGGGTASFIVSAYAPNEQQPDGSTGN